MPSNLELIERPLGRGSIRSDALAALAEDAGASRSRALAKVSQSISEHFAGVELSPELKERILSAGNSIVGDGLANAVLVPTTRRASFVETEEQPEHEEKPGRKARRQLPAQEQIARRAFKRQRQAVLSMLREVGKTELVELRKVEAEVAKGSKRSCMHAAYSARVLLQGLADHLFPPASKQRKGRDGRKHKLGPEDFKNRLIAFVEEKLKGQLDKADFRDFVNTLDTVMDWTGGGPHGSHEPHDAERLYTRMLDALYVIARAHAAQSA